MKKLNELHSNKVIKFLNNNSAQMEDEMDNLSPQTKKSNRYRPLRSSDRGQTESETRTAGVAAVTDAPYNHQNVDMFDIRLRKDLVCLDTSGK